MTTRITNTYITCIGIVICMILHLPHIVQVWGIVYLLSGYAKYLFPDKRTAPHFLFILTHRGADVINTTNSMVSFTQAVKNFYTKAFNFKGRATRAEFWWARLYLSIVLSILAYMCIIIKDLPEILILIVGIFMLINIIPTISLQVRRFHDIGESGTMYFAMVFLSLFCEIILPSNLIAVLCNLVIAIFILFQNCWPGERADNEYGYNPYDNSSQPQSTTTNNIDIEDVEL